MRGSEEKSGERLTHTPRFIPADIVSGEFKPFYERLHKSVLSGFLSNIAVKKEKNFYTGARGKEIMLFPGSGLFNRGGNWIVCAEAIETSRMFARTSANIESEWIEELGKHLCRYSYSEARWDRKRGEVMALEKVTLYGLTIVPARRVSYGRINAPEASEIFIRGALLEGDMDGSFPFLESQQVSVGKFFADGRQAAPARYRGGRGRPCGFLQVEARRGLRHEDAEETCQGPGRFIPPDERGGCRALFARSRRTRELSRLLRVR